MFKIQKRRFTFYACILVCTNVLFGQIPKFDDFTIYNHVSNHIDRSVSGLYQDHYGFIWFSGSENIYRFDGVHFISVLDLKDKNFVFPQIQPGRNDILQDQKERYWFLTPTALVRWDPRLPSQWAWTKYGPNTSDSIPLPSNKMHRIAIDSHGFIWLVFDGQDLYKIDPETGKAVQRVDFRIKEPGMRRSEIDAMEYNKADNRIYFGADYIRIIAVNPDNGKIEYPHLPLRNILKKDGTFEVISKESITDFAKDSTDWWLSLTNNIIIRYAFLKGTYKIFRTNTKTDKMLVSRIKKGPNGMIWYADVNHGMQMIDSKTDQMTPLFSDFSNQTNAFGNIMDIYFDKKGVMWLATGKCLAKYDPSEHFFKEYLPNSAFQNTIPYIYFQDKMDNEFIGTNRGLLYKLIGEKTFSNITIKQAPKGSINIINIIFWYKDHYLLGTTNGIYVLQLSTKEIKKLEVKGNQISLDQYYENPANSIVLDTIGLEPVIWLGSKLRYLYKYVPKTKNIQVVFPDQNNPEAYHHQVVHNIIRTPNGDIWVGTMGGGISKMIDKQNVKFNSWQNNKSDLNSIQNNNIIDFDVTAKGTFWLSTITGIDVYNHKNFKHITLVPNISKYISDEVKGNNSDIWSISANELVRWSDEGKLIKIYSKGKYDFNSMFFKRNGEIILWESKSDQFTDFSSTKLYVFNSEIAINKNDLPQTIITHFEVINSDSSHMLFRTKNILSYDQNNISFSFACLSFRLSQSNQFSWKMDGVDDSWSKPVSRNFVSYAALPPGQYIFKVKSCNADGVWDEEGARLVFTILPPFYKTWWFLLLTAIVVMALLWYLLHQRTLRLLALQKVELQKSMAIDLERKRIARDLHDDLGSGLSAIHLYSEYLKNAVLESNPALSDELDKIVTSSGDLNQKVREIIWTNENNEANTTSLISFIKQYVEKLNGVNFINIVIDSSSLLESIQLTQKQHKDLYFSVKEALNNAIKYANATEVVIRLWTESDNKLFISIVDNGQGFDVQTALLKGGNGLKNIISRISELNGQVKFISNITGTTVRMSI